MRKLIVLLVLLLITAPVNAQDPTATPIPLRDPHDALAGSLADECGAIDYLMERYTIRRDAFADVAIPSETINDIADIYVAGMQYRDGVLAIETVPDCAQEVHQLTLQNITASMDGVALYLAGRAVPSGGDNYAFKSGELSARLAELIDQLDAELIELGWLNEDKEIIIELPG